VHIVREKHPLQGQALRVLGRMHRQGTLQLILSLPDGGTALIPAAWTDLSGAVPLSRLAGVLGRVADLIHTRRVVDVLLQRQGLAGSGPAEQEDAHATGTVSNRSTVTGATARAGAPEPGGTKGADQDAGTAAGQDHPSANERGDP
jgi:hypothetical protein